MGIIDKVNKYVGWFVRLCFCLFVGRLLGLSVSRSVNNATFQEDELNERG